MVYWRRIGRTNVSTPKIVIIDARITELDATVVVRAQ
jgi:hypothetical protein